MSARNKVREKYGLVTLLFLSLHFFAIGQRTMLDGSFSSNGTKVLHVGQADAAYGVVVTSDDKILVAGGVDGKAVVAKFQNNGDLDSSFGSMGISYPQQGGRCILSLASGTILTAGTDDPVNGGGPYFGVARLLANGLLDTSFNHTGFTRQKLFSSTDDCKGMVVQPDDKILLAGDGQHYPLFARFLPDGRVDSSFGTNGKVVEMRQYIGHESQIYAVLLQPDGKFIGVGNIYDVWNPSHKNDFLLLRYNSDGSPDSSFGVNGVAMTDFGAYDYAFAAALQPDGKILAAGVASDQGSTGDDFALARYNINGSLDTSFGTNGLATTDVSGNAEWDVAYSIKLQSDGKIVLGGRSYGHTRTFAVVRYLPSGTVDSSWGNNGSINTNVGGYDDEIYDLALQSGGKIVAVGFSVDSTTQGISNTHHFALARYHGEVTIAVQPIGQPNGNVTLYPNPVSDVLHVRVADFQSASMYNIQGELIRKIDSNAVKNGIDVRSLAPGMYLLCVQERHGKSTQKFMKR